VISLGRKLGERILEENGVRPKRDLWGERPKRKRGGGLIGVGGEGKIKSENASTKI